MGDGLYQRATQDAFITILQDFRFAEDLDEQVLSHGADAAHLPGAQGKDLAEAVDVVTELVVDSGYVLRRAHGAGVLQVFLDAIPDPMLVVFTMTGQLFQLEGAQVPGAGHRVGELSLVHGGLAGLDAVHRQGGATPGWHQAAELHRAQLCRPYENLRFTHQNRRRQRVVDVNLTDDARIGEAYASPQPLRQRDDVGRLGGQRRGGKQRVDDHVGQVRRRVVERRADDETVNGTL